MLGHESLHEPGLKVGSVCHHDDFKALCKSVLLSLSFPPWNHNKPYQAPFSQPGHHLYLPEQH